MLARRRRLRDHRWPHQMNEELLLKCPLAVQEEHWRQRDLLGVMERALRVALAAYRAGRAPDELPGSAPALDASELEWVDWAITQGSLVFHEQLEMAA